LRKDRTFFFLTYEGQREDGALPRLARVPTSQEIATAIIADSGIVNPVTARLLALQPWPAPNRPRDENDNNLQAATRFSNRVSSLIAKIDHRLRQSDLLTVRYFFGDSDQSFPLALVAGGGLPGFNTVTPTTVYLVLEKDGREVGRATTDAFGEARAEQRRLSAESRRPVGAGSGGRGFSERAAVPSRDRHPRVMSPVNGTSWPSGGERACRR
jgi:hypothetical protein